MKANGIIAIPSAITANSELAQWTLKLPYMLPVAKGKHTAVIERIVIAAACADAELCWYVSVR
jgi:hypothetical protein